MHLKRWITAIVAIPVLVALIIKGPPAVFAGLIALIAVLSMWEYFYIVSRGNKTGMLKPIPIAGAVVGLLIIAAALYGAFSVMLLLVFAALLIAALLSMPAYQSGPEIMETVAGQVQGVVYIPLALAALVLLRGQPDGLTWIFFVVLVVFLGDVAAFYVGSYLGRHKLSPAISPGKTVEGALGGLAVNIVVALVFKTLLLPELAGGLVVVFALALGIAGQIGDLFESELKRAAGIKDSGGILPGHGGMLDRVDALIFAAPVACAFNMFVF
ncbi:MAG: phosphatidate cytidylyltransferase [Desulfobacterales bacterium]|nr:phosphatidate cytidylyltransferase [Desulfobacterales bacterium]MBS3754568.1 phosphatidate cytidylyltransferase [Desulfobacterales bacterium]